MSKNILESKAKTYQKLEAILSASKLKVLNRMSKVKDEASYHYSLSLFSKNIFEKAFNSFEFESEIYKNSFNTNKKINVLFLEDKMTLSQGRTRVVSSFKNSIRSEDINIVVSAVSPSEFEGLNVRHVLPENLLSLGHEISHRYVTKKYDTVNVFSSINGGKESFCILPMEKLTKTKEFNYDSILEADVYFYPSIDFVIEKAFFEYVKGLMKYFYIFGQYSSLKESLVKHESSLDAVEEKFESLKKEINKFRQTKITNEILMGSEVSND